MRLAALPLAVRIASANLPPPAPKHPADHIIAATARAFGYAVVARDGELIHYATAGHLEAVAC